MGLNTDLPTFEIGCPSNRVDVTLRDFFKPDALPNAGCSRIPDGMRISLPVLLSTRLGKIERIIVRADYNLLRSGFTENVSDVCVERRVPALMRTDLGSIHPHGSSVIDCFEVKDQAISGR